MVNNDKINAHFSSAKVAYRASSTGAYSAYLQVTEPAGIPGVSDDLWAPVAEGSTIATEMWWGVLPTETGKPESFYDNYQFRVELYDDNDGLIAVSQGTEVKSLAELKTLQAAFTGTGTHLSSTWVVSNFQTIPEPTSGLLMLIGLAGLALKRKRG